MKNKRVVFFVCTLVMITAFSAMATTNTQEKTSNTQTNKSAGRLFTYLPYDPGYTADDYWGYYSSSGLDAQVFENFTDVIGPIRSIHWWGFCGVNESGTWVGPGDPGGMTFTIAFYKENMSNPTYPGNLNLSFSNAKPTITATGVLYPDPTGPYEMYFFEYDLPAECNLSDGWVSILCTGSDNNCFFAWMGSTDGDLDARIWSGGHWDGTFFYDMSLVLTDSEESAVEIVDVTGGAGVTVQFKNNGDITTDNFPVHIVVKGGLLKKIEVKIKDTISELAPNNTTSLQTGKIFGLGKITIFVVGDGIIAYKHGIQLFTYTIIQK
jgi:hypothetical protein